MRVGAAIFVCRNTESSVSRMVAAELSAGIATVIFKLEDYGGASPKDVVQRMKQIGLIGCSRLLFGQLSSIPLSRALSAVSPEQHSDHAAAAIESDRDQTKKRENALVRARDARRGENCLQFK